MSKNLSLVQRSTVQGLLFTALLLLSTLASAASLLTAGQTLTGNQNITSNNGDFRLVMQTDGNLVLYRLSDWTALWSSGTNGNSGAFAIMQGDGNLVVYKNTTPLWSSNTNGNPNAYLNMQTDGNLVIYSASDSPLWESDTRQAVCQDEEVHVWGGRFEIGVWRYQGFLCSAYVPLQHTPSIYYHSEYVPGFGNDVCEIYPTYSGTITIEVCN